MRTLAWEKNEELVRRIARERKISAGRLMLIFHNELVWHSKNCLKFPLHILSAVFSLAAVSRTRHSEVKWLIHTLQRFFYNFAIFAAARELRTFFLCCSVSLMRNCALHIKQCTHSSQRMTAKKLRERKKEGTMWWCLKACILPTRFVTIMKHKFRSVDVECVLAMAVQCLFSYMFNATYTLSCIIHKDHERRFMWFYVTNYSPLHDWALGGERGRRSWISCYCRATRHDSEERGCLSGLRPSFEFECSLPGARAEMKKKTCCTNNFLSSFHWSTFSQ